MQKNMKMKFKDKSQIKVICFDFDGTVVDSMPSLTDLAVNIITNYYNVHEKFAKEEYLKTTGLSFDQQINIIFPHHRNNTIAIQEFEKHKKRNYINLKLVKNAKKVLTYLKNKKYIVAISSSTFPNLIKLYLRKFELPYDLALGYNLNFKKGKDHFDYIFNEFDIKHNNICYIGDTPNDYNLAKENNIQFIAKIGLFAIEDFHQKANKIIMIHDLQELTSIFP